MSTAIKQYDKKLGKLNFYEWLKFWNVLYFYVFLCHLEILLISLFKSNQ